MYKIKEYIKNRSIKISKKKIILSSFLINIYNHIKNNYPPSNNKFFSISIYNWYKFSYEYYPFFSQTIFQTHNWSKFMYLIYYTYIISYCLYYNLNTNLNFDLPKYDNNLMKIIFKTYNNLNDNIPLIIFRMYEF